MQEIYIIDGARTPVGVLQGSLSDITATDLGVIAAKGALARSGVDPNWVDQVVMGNVIQSSKDAIYLARHVALKAGLPIEVPALTVNRLCGSGLQAIVNAAQMLQLGEGQIALAGGAENMTQSPHVIRGARNGFKLGQAPQLEDSLWEYLIDTYVAVAWRSRLKTSRNAMVLHANRPTSMRCAARRPLVRRSRRDF